MALRMANGKGLESDDISLRQGVMDVMPYVSSVA